MGRETALQRVRWNAEGWLTLDNNGHTRSPSPSVRESPQSLHRQSVVARRLQSLSCQVETVLEFQPQTFQQAAGLGCWYDDECFFAAQVTWDERAGKCLKLLGSERGKLKDLTPEPVLLARRATWLRARLAGERLQFSFSEDGTTFVAVGPELDATLLSDEATSLGLGFTGAFAAVFAYDLGGTRREADFDYFEYSEQ